MSNPYIGEIIMFGGNYAPAGWAFCDGSLQDIAQNTALFNLIGTTYGGDGQNTFALPDLRGRIPIHQGQSPGISNYVIGQLGGIENATLTILQIPSHTHIVTGNSGTANTTDPSNNFLAAQPQLMEYSSLSNDAMKANATTTNAGSQPHNNIMPVLTVNYIISLYGIYPSQN